MKSLRKGFTLVEVLLALSIGSLILVAATALLITIAQSWSNRPATRDAFLSHVNGVSNFLSVILEEASFSITSKAGDPLVNLKRPTGFSSTDDPLVHFFLKEAPPLFYSPHGPAVRVHIFIFPEEDEGLSLLWFSELNEVEKNKEGGIELVEENDLQKTLISPFFKEMYYCYYGSEDDSKDDVKEWEISDQLLDSDKNGQFRLPTQIKLVFRWDEEELEKTVTIAIEKPIPSGIEEEPK
jgi:prepilin-type N-terminal cleavage/methylation domain-containing protein